MTTWNISSRSTGLDFGNYEGEEPLDAANAMARDAGYADIDAASEAIGEDFLMDLRLVEVIR